MLPVLVLMTTCATMAYTLRLRRPMSPRAHCAAAAGVLCVEVCQVLLAPLTLEVEQQHVAALAEFFAAAAEPLRSPAGASDQGAPSRV